MPRNFKDVKATQEAVEKAERAAEADARRKCDWDDPEDAALYRHDTQLQARVALLLALSPSMKCPVCTLHVPSHRSWVINKARSKAVCRTCFSEPRFLNPPSGVQLDFGVFKGKTVRFALEGQALFNARMRAGMSIRSFCRAAGWSPGYQQKLETHTRSVSEDTARTILTVLREAGVHTMDSPCS